MGLWCTYRALTLVASALPFRSRADQVCDCDSQVVETAVAVGGAYFFMPKNPDLKDPVLRVHVRFWATTHV